MNATISADIIGSTSLSITELEDVTNQIKRLLQDLEGLYNTNGEVFWGRLIKGDYIECYMSNPNISLRVALLIKAAIKKYAIKLDSDCISKIDIKKRKLFKEYGARIAIGIGGMNKVDRTIGIMDGEAIYLSGRKINEMYSTGKEKITIKQTLFFESSDNIFDQFLPICNLIDILIRDSMPRQCDVLYLKLLGLQENEIAVLLNIKQSTVNQHSTSLGWGAIESALKYYESFNFD